MKTTKHPRTRPAKMGRAKIMYEIGDGTIYPTECEAMHAYAGSIRPANAISVLPRSRATDEAMIRKAALALGRLAHREAVKENIPGGIYIVRKLEADDIKWYAKYARACLAAVGLVDKEPTP